MSTNGRDPATDGLDIYVVGGAVRDHLLGLTAGDRDWVVVGATPEIMAGRGFMPVGGDFPVFLHPQTHEEYALARTERKSGRGYRGFVFHAGQDVSLEEDLRRRDLTVNAMAMSPDGRLIDPLDGMRDLQSRVLRHVGDAFLEDPVRLLRLARFAARFDNFTIAPETMLLCRSMVENGEVDALVPERVWQEFAKGLMSRRPGRMLDVLAESTALARIAPALVWDADAAKGLQNAACADLGLEQRYALMCLSSSPALQEQLRAPTACRDMARLLPAVISRLRLAGQAGQPADWLGLIESCDAIRRPGRFLEVLQAAACITDPGSTAQWSARLDAVQSVDAGKIARAAQGRPELIRQRLHQARLQALAHLQARP